MCNLSEYVWREAWKEGWKEGKEQALLSALQNLMKNMGWPVEQAMNALSVPEADRPKYAAKLAQK